MKKIKLNYSDKKYKDKELGGGSLIDNISEGIKNSGGAFTLLQMFTMHFKNI